MSTGLLDGCHRSTNQRDQELWKGFVFPCDFPIRDLVDFAYSSLHVNWSNGRFEVLCHTPVGEASGTFGKSSACSGVTYLDSNHM